MLFRPSICKKIIILSKKDKKTFNAISGFKCQIIKQKIDGYGAALIEGINNVETKYLCIFNADGSFDPKYLNKMINYVINLDRREEFVKKLNKTALVYDIVYKPLIYY